MVKDARARERERERVSFDPIRSALFLWSEVQRRRKFKKKKVQTFFVFVLRERGELRAAPIEQHNEREIDHKKLGVGEEVAHPSLFELRPATSLLSTDPR